MAYITKRDGTIIQKGESHGEMKARLTAERIRKKGSASKREIRKHGSTEKYLAKLDKTASSRYAPKTETKSSKPSSNKMTKKSLSIKTSVKNKSNSNLGPRKSLVATKSKIATENKKNVEMDAKTKAYQKKLKGYDAYEKRLKKISKMEKKASERDKNLMDTIKLIPGLKGDSFLQKVGQNVLALPARATVGFGNQIYIAGAKIGAIGEGMVKAPKNTLKALGQAAKDTPKAVATAYDPRTPEGLVNIAGTLAITGALGKSKSNARALTPKNKGAIKPKTTKTVVHGKGKTQVKVTTDKGSFVNKKGQTIKYRTETFIGKDGKGSFRVKYTDPKGKIIKQSTGALEHKATIKKDGTYTAETKINPKKGLSTTEKTSGKIIQSKPKTVGKNKAQVSKTLVESKTIRTGKGAGKSATTKQSTTKIQGKTKTTVETRNTGNHGRKHVTKTKTLKPKEITETKIKQVTKYPKSKTRRIAEKIERGIQNSGNIFDMRMMRSKRGSLGDFRGRNNNPFDFRSTGEIISPHSTTFHVPKTSIKASGFYKNINPSSSMILTNSIPVVPSFPIVPSRTRLKQDIISDPNINPGIKNAIISELENKDVTDPGTDPGIDPAVDPGVDPAIDPGIDEIPDSRTRTRYETYLQASYVPQPMPQVTPRPTPFAYLKGMNPSLRRKGGLPVTTRVKTQKVYQDPWARLTGNNSNSVEMNKMLRRMYGGLFV